MATKAIDFTKHIWEGWTVGDFISELEPSLDTLYAQKDYNSYAAKPFESKDAMRNYCKENQPYYKKRIVEVANYFIQKYHIK